MDMPQQSEKVKGVVDIVFLIDATGSMQPFINGLKENIKVFIDGLGAGGANEVSPVKDWRAKVVGYRDYADDYSTWLEDNPFVRDVGQLKAQLDNLQAKGGGDEPESLLDALFTLAKMPQTGKGESDDTGKWRYRSSAARVVIVFTDASYHETMSIPDAKGGVLFDDVRTVVEAGRIILSVFAPDLPCHMKLGSLDKAEFMRLADQTGKLITLDEFTRDKKNFEETMRQLAKSVSKSATTDVL